MSKHTLSVSGTKLLLDGAHFPFQGLSFFNAIYNPAFNRSNDEATAWLKKFKSNGVNALRVWCQWDYIAPRLFVDTGADATLYTTDGDVHQDRFAVLANLIDLIDAQGMTIEVTLFSHEKQPNLDLPALANATRQMTRLLKPYRSLILQFWNEDSTDVIRLGEIAKSEDGQRIITNSPGFSDVLGDEQQNTLMDVLTPHTNRTSPEGYWVVAPRQIEMLLKQYQKPVIDGEPARNGIAEFGGRPGAQPWQHIVQIQAVRAAGGYHLYHHDMFQKPYGFPATPPSGIPDPDFSPYHRQVFDFLRDFPAVP